MGEQVSTTRPDLWIYQETVHETNPELVVAVDTPNAGYLADLYGPLVSRGCDLIVEDTSDPVRARAVAEFANQNPAFVADRSKEKLYLTFNGGGYLRRRR